MLNKLIFILFSACLLLSLAACDNYTPVITNRENSKSTNSTSSTSAASSSSAPAAPSSSAPAAPSSSTPAAPSSSAPAVPPSSTPAVPSSSASAVPSSSAPAVPSSSAPAVPSSSAPAAPSSSTPAAPSSSAPAASSSSAPAASSSSAPAASSSSDSSIVGQIEQKVLQLVNEERSRQNLGRLQWNTTLYNSAKVRCNELVSGASTSAISHTRPDGRDCFTAFKEAGYQYTNVYENIIAGDVFSYYEGDPDKIAQIMFDGWKNSPSHYSAMIAPEVTETAIAFVISGDDVYGVEHFGNPM